MVAFLSWLCFHSVISSLLCTCANKQPITPSHHHIFPTPCLLPLLPLVLRDTHLSQWGLWVVASIWTRLTAAERSASSLCETEKASEAHSSSKTDVQTKTGESLQICTVSDPLKPRLHLFVCADIYQSNSRFSQCERIFAGRFPQCHLKLAWLNTGRFWASNRHKLLVWSFQLPE